MSFDQIQFEIEKACKQNMLLMVRNWNAKVGNVKEENIVGLYVLVNGNEAEDQLINFCHSK